MQTGALAGRHGSRSNCSCPLWTGSRRTTCSLYDGRRLLASQPITLAPALKEIVVVFKTHFDIGYTDMASNIVQRYRTTMIDQALDVVDQNRDLPPQQQFAWTLAGWPLHKILQDWPGQSPQRKERVEKALREGRFVVHGLPFTTHTELLEAEDLVRSLGYSARLARRLGLDLPRDGKMTDVPEHTWMMATLLKHAGIDFMMIGCNGASAPLKVPLLYLVARPRRLPRAHLLLARLRHRSSPRPRTGPTAPGSPASTPATTTARRGPTRSRRSSTRPPNSSRA